MSSWSRLLADDRAGQLKLAIVLFLQLAVLGLEVGDLGGLLVVVGLELVDLGQERLPLGLVLVVLGLQVGLAVGGGLGLDVDRAAWRRSSVDSRLFLRPR